MNDIFTIRSDGPEKRIQQAMDAVEDRSEESMVPALHAVVTKERALLGKGPVTLDACRTADRMASGHVDYCRKIAYYGRDLVLQEGDS